MDFASLNEISEALSHSLDLEPVLNEVVATIQRMLEVDAIWLHLVGEMDGERTKLHLAVQNGMSQAYANGRQHLTINDTIEGEVAKENKARYINDASQGKPLSELDGIQSVAVIPLSCPEIVVDGEVRRRVVGVLTVAMHKLHSWQPRQARLLNTVANQMAFAINNAQLYSQVKEDMEAYSLSSQFLQKVNDSLMGVGEKRQKT
jgi:GAF domain-containing protein